MNTKYVKWMDKNTIMKFTKKYGEKIKMKKEKISELIERNHQLRKQLIIKQKKIKAKVHTLQDFKTENIECFQNKYKSNNS